MSKYDSDIRDAVRWRLLKGGEAYSVQFYEYWYEKDPRNAGAKKQALPRIQKVLTQMETEGILESRVVLPEEHRGSQNTRRYYKLKVGPAPSNETQLATDELE